LPLMFPLVDKVRPAGSEPETAFHVYGAVPPVT